MALLHRLPDVHLALTEVQRLISPHAAVALVREQHCPSDGAPSAAFLDLYHTWLLCRAGVEDGGG